MAQQSEIKLKDVELMGGWLWTKALFLLSRWTRTSDMRSMDIFFIEMMIVYFFCEHQDKNICCHFKFPNFPNVMNIVKSHAVCAV